MFLAFGVLVLPGVVVNNLQNNGVISTNQAMTCTTANGGTCVLAANVGCQVSTTFCQLQGSSISFLNACSPFTGFITFNFATFVESFFTNCGHQQSVAPPNTSVLYAQGTWTLTCSMLGPPFVSTSGLSAQALATCSAVTPLLTTPNGTMAIGGPWVATPIVGGGQALFSCLAGVWNGVIGNASAGSVPTAAQTCIQGYILPAGCTALTCSPVSNQQCLSGQMVNNACIPYDTVNTQCLAYGDYGGSISSPGNRIKSLVCTNLASANQFYIPGVSNYFQNFNIASVLTFAATIFGAAIIVWLSLGLGFTIGGSVIATGASVGFTTNPQGSKLAQTFGFAILLWGPLYSEFSSWFTNGFLPYGLDGTIGIVSIGITALFFIGTYGLSQSGTAAAQ